MAGSCAARLVASRHCGGAPTSDGVPLTASFSGAGSCFGDGTVPGITPNGYGYGYDATAHLVSTRPVSR
jgi:hypothetical protein